MKSNLFICFFYLFSDRSKAVRYCFHRCLSVHNRGRGTGGVPQGTYPMPRYLPPKPRYLLPSGPGEGYPKVPTPTPPLPRYLPTGQGTYPPHLGPNGEMRRGYPKVPTPPPHKVPTNPARSRWGGGGTPRFLPHPRDRTPHGVLDTLRSV